MKHLLKILFLLPLFFSCTNTQEEPIPTPEEEQTAIGFAAKVENSRAIADLNMVKNNGFAVWGGYGSTEVFTGDEVTYAENTTEWGYENSRYWTYNDYYFYAIYPNQKVKTYDSVEGLYTEKKLTINNFDSTKGYDLMYGTAFKEYAGTPTLVEFQFNHTLTQLAVQLKKGVDNSDDYISVLGIYFNCKVNGNYTLDGTNEEIGGEWSESENAVSSYIGVNCSESPIVLTTTYTECGKEILVIPQKLDDVNMVVVIRYIPGNPNPDDNLINQTAPQYIPYSLKGTEDWEISKSIIYQCEITRDKEIIFSKPNIRPWDNVSGGSIIID